MKPDTDNLISKINGIIQIIISTGFIYFNSNLLYEYNFTSKLFFVMIPEWILILNVFFGIIGIITGIKTFKRKMKIWKGYLVVILIIGIGIALINISTL